MLGTLHTPDCPQSAQHSQSTTACSSKQQRSRCTGLGCRTCRTHLVAEYCGPPQTAPCTTSGLSWVHETEAMSVTKWAHGTATRSGSHSGSCSGSPSALCILGTSPCSWLAHMPRSRTGLVTSVLGSPSSRGGPQSLHLQTHQDTTSATQTVPQTATHSDSHSDSS